MSNKPVAFRFTPEEVQILKAYAQQEGRTQSDLVREYVRSLKEKIQKSDN